MKDNQAFRNLKNRIGDILALNKNFYMIHSNYLPLILLLLLKKCLSSFQCGTLCQWLHYCHTFISILMCFSCVRVFCCCCFVFFFFSAKKCLWWIFRLSHRDKDIKIRVEGIIWVPHPSSYFSLCYLTYSFVFWLHVYPVALQHCFM